MRHACLDEVLMKKWLELMCAEKKMLNWMYDTEVEDEMVQRRVYKGTWYRNAAPFKNVCDFICLVQLATTQEQRLLYSWH